MTPEEIARLPYRPCVGVVLANDEGRVFLGQRADVEAPAWQMPQGGIDPGETPRQAALRELEEETGLRPDQVRVEAETAGWLRYDLPAEMVPRLAGGRFRGQEQKWVLCRLVAPDTAINLQTAHPEFRAWRWATPEEAIAEIVAFKRPIYEAVLAEFAPHLGKGPAAIA